MALRLAVRPTSTTLLLFILLTGLAHAHEHHDEDVTSAENLAKPIDSLMWLHILIQITTWGFMFPIGMVLGLAR